MTEPRIQYAKTSDGVSIAYWTLGEGMPLVYMPAPTSHIQLEWQKMPEARRWYERLAEKRKLIRYDGRGIGLSERNVTDLSLDTAILDLEAIVGRLALERFALYVPVFYGPAAIFYAAHHPERVSHLVLCNTYARGSDLKLAQGLVGLMSEDWELFTETYAHVGLGWSAGEPARRIAALLRESTTPDVLQRGVRKAQEVDVTAFLPKVDSPTLVLHRRQVRIMDTSVATGLASHIPNARLVLLEGEATAPYLGDVDAMFTAIDEFLSEGEEGEAGADAPEAGAFRTILFTDVEGSTALTERLGDAKARGLLREHERIVRVALKSHRGSEVKAMGDGFMASFPSATKALECAIAMQRAFAEHNASAGEPVRIRIGLNAGEPIAEDDDLFGTSVNRAARIAAMAKGGEILVANVVRELAEGKGFMFADRGETELRGFEDAVGVYEVRWRDE